MSWNTIEIKWIDASKELPDDDIDVMVANAKGEVWVGHHDTYEWYAAEGYAIEVTHWAEMPEHPNAYRVFKFCYGYTVRKGDKWINEVWDEQQAGEMARALNRGDILPDEFEWSNGSAVSA